MLNFECWIALKNRWFSGKKQIRRASTSFIYCKMVFWYQYADCYKL